MPRHIGEFIEMLTWIYCGQVPPGDPYHQHGASLKNTPDLPGPVHPGTSYSFSLEFFPLLRFQIRNPRYIYFFTPGSRMGKNPIPASGINNPDHISECLVTIFGLKILKFFVNLVLRIRIRDPVSFSPLAPGWNNPYPGWTSRIRNTDIFIKKFMRNDIVTVQSLFSKLLQIYTVRYSTLRKTGTS